MLCRYVVATLLYMYYLTLTKFFTIVRLITLHSHCHRLSHVGPRLVESIFKSTPYFLLGFHVNNGDRNSA